MVVPYNSAIKGLLIAMSKRVRQISTAWHFIKPMQHIGLLLARYKPMLRPVYVIQILVAFLYVIFRTAVQQ